MWDKCGISARYQCGISVVSAWDQCGISVESVCQRCGISVGSVWDQCGINVGSIMWDQCVCVSGVGSAVCVGSQFNKCKQGLLPHTIFKTNQFLLVRSVDKTLLVYIRRAPLQPAAQASLGSETSLSCSTPRCSRKRTDSLPRRRIRILSFGAQSLLTSSSG